MTTTIRSRLIYNMKIHAKILLDSVYIFGWKDMTCIVFIISMKVTRTCNGIEYK